MQRAVFHHYLIFGSLAVGTCSAVQPVHAQQSAPPRDVAAAPDIDLDDDFNLDPDQPLTEFPDFGVEWPDLDHDTSDDAQQADQAANDAGLGDDLDESELAAEEKQLLLDGDQDGEVDIGVQAYQPSDLLLETGYQVEIVGLPPLLNDNFNIRFKTLSALEEHQGEDANFGQIKRRAESDRELIENLLRIEGYYDATVDAKFAANDSQGVTVSIRISPGPVYHLADITLPGLEQSAAGDIDGFRSSFGLHSGDVINNDLILAARDRLKLAMANQGYPFSSSDEPELQIDHAGRDGDLKLAVTPGGKYNFGSIILPNTELFSAKHVQLIARFEPGDLYNADDVEDLRRALIATGLVSSISVKPVPSSKPENVDLAVDLTAAPLRTIAGQIGYGTGEGLRTEVSWEHRNFFPPEGLLRVATVIATQEQSGSISFRRNNFQRRDNILNGRFALSNVERAAYKAQTLTLAANIERQSSIIFQKRWSWSLGGEFLASRERDIVGAVGPSNSRTFFIGSLPGSFTFDTSDDLLDPSTGFRLTARAAPEVSVQNGSSYYLRSQVDGSAYVSATDHVVLAGRARFGSIIGARNSQVAPSRRLYSGGGGSVRGYSYQSIGPRDINDDPVGGRSLVEFSLEARVRTGYFGGALGIVPFIDAGNVYTNSEPDFRGLRFGAGIGLRYYSDFGPIRIDVGTPVNPRPGDTPVTVFVSLGQAF